VRLPDFIIIGAMKCATSTLHEQLAAQAGLYLSEPKEPCFFSDDDVWSRGLEWYSTLFSAAAREQLCGESSTHYTKLPTHPDTVERMHRFLPDVRLVYVMRHPVDRLVSHYVHAWSERETSDPIEVAIERMPEFTSYGCYARQLAPYLEAYGRGALLPVFFERLVANPQVELERVVQFIGSPAKPRWQPALGRENASDQRLRRGGVRGFLVSAPALRFIRRTFVPRAVRARVKARWQMQDRPTVSADVRRSLESRFDPDLSELGQWLGCAPGELSCATWTDTVTTRTLDWSERTEASS